VFGESFWVDQVLPPPDVTGRQPTPRHARSHLRAAAGDHRSVDGLKPRGNFNTLCVTDVRYPNEAERVLALDGEVWEVVRPGLEPDGHSSEEPLPRELVTWSTTAPLPREGRGGALMVTVEQLRSPGSVSSFRHVGKSTGPKPYQAVTRYAAGSRARARWAPAERRRRKPLRTTATT
jgi:hypothetical protein